MLVVTALANSGHSSTCSAASCQSSSPPVGHGLLVHSSQDCRLASRVQRGLRRLCSPELDQDRCSSPMTHVVVSLTRHTALHDVQPAFTPAFKQAPVGAVLRPGAAAYLLVVKVAHDITFLVTRCQLAAGQQMVPCGPCWSAFAFKCRQCAVARSEASRPLPDDVSLGSK